MKTKYHCQKCRAVQINAELVKKLYRKPTRAEQKSVDYWQSKVRWYTDNHITT